MAKGTVHKRELTASEKDAARRLKTAWEDYKSREENKGVNQEWLGRESGVGNQSAVGQYLNAVIPLNHKALFAICKVINTDPATISPELTTTLPKKKIAEVDPEKKTALVYVDAEELQILTAYREANKTGKRGILASALSAPKDAIS